MSHLRIARSHFLASFLVLCLGLAAPAVAQPKMPTRAPEDAPSTLRITEPNEPGEPLVVHGVVTDAAGDPVPDASVFVYQTGADGIYGPEGNAKPRIHGYLRTDEQGRFQLRTTKPGSYPGSNVAPHIHLHASAPGSDREVTKELVFEGDPQVSDRMRRSSFYYVGDVEEEDGVLHVDWKVSLG